MKGIYIIDSFSHHSFHEVFSASLISICGYIFKDISYYSCKSTKICIKNILVDRSIGNSRIEFRNIFVFETDNKYLLLLRYFISSIVNIIYLFKVPKNVIIIYCYNNIFVTPVLNVLNKILHKKVVIFCHGELELVNDVFTENIGPISKLIKKNIISFFLNKNIKITQGLIFIVLGEGILSNLKAIVSPHIVNSMYAIDHSFVFEKCEKRDNHQNKLNFGTIGVVSKVKNINQFIRLTRMFLSEIEDKKIAFSATGAVYYKKNTLLDTYINIPDKYNGLISRDSFNRRIQELDYILFFYHSGMYKYLASGAVFDAINAEKPIIALRNDYFEYLFSKFGAFGYLVDSIDDMADIIRGLLSGKKLETFAFGEIKERLSPPAISCQFKLILKKMGFLN